MYWVFYPIISCILWGVGYAFLKQVSMEVKVYTINSLYGLSTFIVNIIIISITNNFQDFNILKDIKLALYLTFYIILSIISSIVFLLGYSIDNINPGVYIIIANTYPIITFILSYFIFNITNINLYYGIPGIFITLIGMALLAMSKN